MQRTSGALKLKTDGFIFPFFSGNFIVARYILSLQLNFNVKRQ